MKILQVASSLTDKGGIEKLVLRLSSGLIELGHEVEIAAVPDSWVWERAKAENIKLQPLIVKRQYDFSALKPCMELFRRERYDIVNLHFAPDFIVPALAARLAHQSNVVMTRHLVKKWRGTKAWMYGRGLGYRKIIGVSNAVRNALVSGGIPDEMIEVVHVGVNLEPIVSGSLRSELGLPASRVLIGIVSRVSAEKGHADLLEAMLQADAKAVCVVIGDGPDLLKLKEYALSHGLSERAFFLGWRTDSDALVASLDIVVQPSVWEEACSAAILEGMARGKPLVVTDSGGNAELVLNGKTGIVVPKSDPTKLAEALNILIRDPDLRRQYGENGLTRQQSLFTKESMCKGTEEVFFKLISKQ